MKGFFIIFCIFFTSCSVNSLTLNDYLASVGDDSSTSEALEYIAIDVVAVDGLEYVSEDGKVRFDTSANKIFQNRNNAVSYIYVKPRYSEGVGKDYIYTLNGKYYGLQIFTPIKIGFMLVPQDTITTIPWDTTDPTEIIILHQEQNS